MSYVGESWISQFVFVLISFSAFLGNAMVLCVFVMQRNSTSKKMFDIFIINLAATDLLTGIFLLCSRFVYLPSMPGSQPQAYIFCHFLWGGYILFGFGYVSVYTCLALTIERWLAITKPYFYLRLKPRHAILTVAVVWIWAFLINSTVFVSIEENFQEGKCQWIKPKMGNDVLPFVEISVACLLPFLGIIVLYWRIFYRIHRKPLFFQENRLGTRRRLTVLAVIASIALIIGWLPTKISYMLRFTNVGGGHFYGTMHTVFVMMSLGNSCINPILYGICSSKFRKEYKMVVDQLFCRRCRA